jgi:hypothetical protein
MKFFIDLRKKNHIWHEYLTQIKRYLLKKSTKIHQKQELDPFASYMILTTVDRVDSTQILIRSYEDPIQSKRGRKRK